jgi:WD40 repeat protein
LYNYPSGTVNFTTTNFNGMTIYSVKQMPDNVTLICGMGDGKTTLFSLATNTIGLSYSAHTTTVDFLDLTPDAVYVVSGAKDSLLVMWTWATMSLTQVSSKSTVNQVFSGALVTGAFNGGKILLNSTRYS